MPFPKSTGILSAACTLVLAAAGILSSAALAASPAAPPSTVSWKAESADAGDGTFRILLTGDVAEGWHIYGTDNEWQPTSVTLLPSKDYTVTSPLAPLSEAMMANGQKTYSGTVLFAIGIKPAKAGHPFTVSGSVGWQACTGGTCSMPEEWDFSVEISPDKAVNKNVIMDNNIVIHTDNQGNTAKSPWALIIEAILWGFAMLLTPCVFPMVPMTVSYFIKGSPSPAAGRFRAFMYGVFIVLLYTVPIAVIITATRLIGGEAVTADIFNWLATHWLPNIIFFVVFMVFAASFLGAFEITLPSSLVNRSDRNSDKGGLAGIFFMALTLVLVSFSCTGPIVGTVLIKSTSGEIWTPVMTMLAFSAAFAIPFTLLALFPQALKKLKSGRWLGSVKIVLGFIELALGLKFLSVADQTYHWGILDREIYLAIWISIFTLLGLYLLKIIHLGEEDGNDRSIGVTRLLLAAGVFAFVIYLIPGMWGAPLKGLSGYLPPMETQDFIVPTGAADTSTGSGNTGASTVTGTVTIAHGLRAYTSVEEACREAAMEGKPVFVDITGHGCVNCREMEQRVWSDGRILPLLRDSLVIAALYTDDKTRLKEEDWVTTSNGKVLKDIGRANSYYARQRFGVSSQPNYIILDPDGNQISPIKSYSLDIDGFRTFLTEGINTFRKAGYTKENI